MDDGMSSIIPMSLNFDEQIESNHSDNEDAEAADAIKREKQIEEDLKNASFGDLIDEDDDDDDESLLSDGESINISGKQYNRYDHSKSSYNKRSKEHSLSSLKHGNNSSCSHSQSSSLEQHSISSEDKSQYSFTHNSRNYNDCNGITANVDNESALKYASLSSKYELNLPKPCGRNYSKELSKEHGANYPVQGGLKSFLNNKAPSQSNSIQEQGPANLPQSVNSYNQEKSTEYGSHHSEQYGLNNGVNTASSAQFSDHPADLHEEYMKLQLLYDTRGSELQQLKREEIHARENFLCEIKSLKLRLTLVEGEKDKLTSSLQEWQKLITDFRSENNLLKGKVAALEMQLSAAKEAKVSAQSKCESAEITIQSLEQQITELSRSENAVRLQSQSDSIMKDLKLRHQKEVLQLKEDIDNLQKHLSSKIEECENLNDKVSQLQQKCEELQIEKSEIFNKLSANLEASQRQCQKLLESGTISEVSVMRLQLQHVEEERMKLEKQNASLKDEVRSLENELQAAESLKHFKNENDEGSKDSSQTASKGDSDKKLSSLQHELKKALKSIQTYRHQNNSLKEKLNELQRQLPQWEEKAKFFEFRHNESEKKAKQLAKKLDEILPGESISKMLHEKELNVLKNELMDLQKKYNDIVERFKNSSSNEKKLLEANISLKNKITDMVKSHESDKMKAVEECREKYLKLCDSSAKKLNDELSAKSDKELQTVCRNYENKISQLEKEIKRLNDCLYDAKAEYVKIFEENSALQSKLDSISVPKDYQDIERAIREEFEKKLNEMKKKFQQFTSVNFEASVKQEVEKIQEEWTNQKMKDIVEFVESTKQRLDEEFKKSVEEEHSRFQSEKETLVHEYEKKIKDLKQQSEIEKDASLEQLRESFQQKWKNEVRELQENHQQELQSIKLKFKEKMLSLENEIKILEDDLSKKSDDNHELQSLKKQLSVEKQTWEDEKFDLESKINSLNEKLRNTVEKEKALREKVKKHQKYSQTLKTDLQRSIDQLIKKNTELENQNALQENQLSELDKKHRKDVHLLHENLKNHSVSKNAECQTEELLVPRVTYLKARNLFIECLRKISGEIEIYLINSRKRTADQLQKALYTYHDQITSKILQDVFENSHVPSLIIPHFNTNSHSTIFSQDKIASPHTLQQEFNAKLTDFTSSDPLASGDMHKRLNSYRNETAIPKALPNPKVRPDSAVRFEDISFDFVPISDSAFMSTRMPDYLRPGGLFSGKADCTKSSYMQKISPITKIN